MIGGKIIDWFTRDGITKFLVKDDNDTCTVRCKISGGKLGLVKTGDSIWWQSDKVYLDCFNTPDVSFPKISTSGGNGLTFYQDKLKDSLPKEE